MKKIIYGAIIFAAGIVIGNVITAELIREKYRRKADEEINSYKEYLDSKYSETDDTAEEVVEEPSEEQPKEPAKKTGVNEERSKYSNMVKNLGYTSDKSEKNTKKKEPVTVEDDEDNFIIISPEEFGELDERTGEVFDMVTLVYYADHVMLYYDDQHQVDDIERLVGTDFKNHFGEYDEYVVYVRNMRNQTDYEIIKDDDKYYDIFGREDEVGRMNDTR